MNKCKLDLCIYQLTKYPTLAAEWKRNVLIAFQYAVSQL